MKRQKCRQAAAEKRRLKQQKQDDFNFVIDTRKVAEHRIIKKDTKKVTLVGKKMFSKSHVFGYVKITGRNGEY